MKALLLPCLLVSTIVAAQTTHTISTVGTTFSPNLVNAVVGDEIQLSIGSPHTFTLTEAGTIWYVCTPHADMGMKGRIIVSTNTGVNDQLATSISLAPNPAMDVVRFTGVPGTARADLYDTKGALVLSHPVASGMLEVSSVLPGSYVCVVRSTDGTLLLRTPLEIRR